MLRSEIKTHFFFLEKNEKKICVFFGLRFANAWLRSNSHLKLSNLSLFKKNNS